MRGDRRIPVSLESEAGLLSGLLLDNEAIHRIPGLDADAFHGPVNAEVFRAIQQTSASAGRPFDTVSVYTHLQAIGSETTLIEPERHCPVRAECSQHPALCRSGGGPLPAAAAHGGRQRDSRHRHGAERDFGRTD